ncbi:MAG: PAS domain S-box protein, partial [Acidobacteriota bacterium]
VALYADGDTLWLVGRDWLGRLGDSGLTVLGADLDFGLGSPGAARAGTAPERVVAAPDGQGGLYLVSAGALRHFDRRRGTLTVLDARRGVDVGVAHCVMLDREGAVWVGGDRGLVQILDRRFSSYTVQDGLYDSAVVSLHRRPGGDLVLGHRGGLSFIDDGAVEGLSLALTSPDGRRLEQVRDIADAADGGLWLAADTRGLGLRSPDGGLRWYGARDGLEGAVTSVLRDAADVLWVGTEDGVRVRRGRRFEALPGAPGLHVRNLADGLDGSLLVATENGLHRYAESEGWSDWRCGRPACDSIFGVLPDALGHWVATASGLYRAPLTGSRLVPSHLPKVAEPVFFVVRDGPRLWLGTEDGVLGITPGGGGVDRLSIEQGLSGRETYRTGALVDGSGRLWVGTERGLSRYDSFFERPPPPPPRVHLTGALVDGVGHPLDARLDLPSDVREATFRFRAVTLSGQHRLRFRSWLEGVDESWLPPYVSESQEIRIAGLAPGTYRFHLQAALGDGEWSAPVASAPIVIRSPFWRRTWFLTAVAALVLASLYLVPSLVVQRRHARHLESEVRRRTAELQASEDRYRKTFRTIEDGVLTTDESGAVALLNPRAEELTGYFASDAVGRPVGEVLRLYQGGDGEKTGPPLALLSA